MSNNPSLKWIYLEAMQNNETSILRNNFKNKKEYFDMVEKIFNDTAKMIHLGYVLKYVQKKKIEINNFHKKTVGQLHGMYKKTKKPITLDDVKTKLMSLKTGSLYWVLKL